MGRVCLHCGTSETSKWFNGPLCRKCYRAQPHIKNREKQSRLKKLNHYNSVARDYRENNKDKVRAKDKKWYEANSQAVSKRKKIYKKVNKDRINSYENKYQKNRRIKDTAFKIKCNLRSRLSKAVSGNFKSGSAVKDLGCSIEDLKKHLESQFTEGMSWENYGKWHIDHIKPLALYDLQDPQQFEEACRYKNLQPLWAEDNLRKGARQ